MTKAGIFCHLHGGPSGPDGLALDDGGGLLVAHAGFGTVWYLSSRAEPLARIASCAGWLTTNLAFVPGTRDIVIIESEIGTILRATTGAAGLPLFSHAEA